MKVILPRVAIDLRATFPLGWPGQLACPGARSAQEAARPVPLVPRLYWGTQLSAQFHCFPVRRPEVDGYPLTS